MNLPKLSALVAILVLATGWTLAWYLEGSDEVRAERMAVELEIARFGGLDGLLEPAALVRARSAVIEAVELLEADTAPELLECPFVPGCDRV